MTPGPWTVTSLDGKCTGILARHVWVVCNDWEPIGDSSDAALIAKVPEMVELLRELEWCESAPYTDDPCCPWCKAEQEHGTHSPTVACTRS